jgi:hypothetical protein
MPKRHLWVAGVAMLVVIATLLYTVVSDDGVFKSKARETDEKFSATYARWYVPGLFRK